MTQTAKTIFFTEVKGPIEGTVKSAIQNKLKPLHKSLDQRKLEGIRNTNYHAWHELPLLARSVLGVYLPNSVMRSGGIDLERLSTTVEFAFLEVKTAKDPAVIKEGAEQTAATALALKASGMKAGVAVLVVDRDAVNNLSAKDKKEIIEKYEGLEDSYRLEKI